VILYADSAKLTQFTYRGFSPVSEVCETTATQILVFRSASAVFVSSGTSGLSTFTSVTFSPTRLASSTTNKIIAPLFVVQWGAKNKVITDLLANQTNGGGDTGGGNPPETTSSGLSGGGAIAGIVIGAVAGLALLIAAIFSFYVGSVTRMQKPLRMKRWNSHMFGRRQSWLAVRSLLTHLRKSFLGTR
jgi:mannan endo-1,6-alpha-mannosidase